MGKNNITTQYNTVEKNTKLWKEVKQKIYVKTMVSKKFDNVIALGKLFRRKRLLPAMVFVRKSYIIQFYLVFLMAICAFGTIP